MKSKLVWYLGAMLIVGSMPNLAPAVQDVVVGNPTRSNRLVSMDEIDHAGWNQLVKKYVNENGQVDYKSWQASTADAQSLDDYLNVLSTASREKQASKAAKLAFWINAYNAVTIKGILREYPTSSIRNHTARLIGYNIWKNLLLAVGDTKISLDAMEHQILREMGEPRIHFAIVCASHSCPRLLNEAYVPSRLSDQLNLNAKNFFANPENFQYDAKSKTFKLSRIMSWFGEDFGSDQAAQLKSIARFLPTREAYDAANQNSVEVSYLEYDWRLNEQK